MIQEQNSPREDRRKLCGSVYMCASAHIYTLPQTEYATAFVLVI